MLSLKLSYVQNHKKSLKTGRHFTGDLQIVKNDTNKKAGIKFQREIIGDKCPPRQKYPILIIVL